MKDTGIVAEQVCPKSRPQSNGYAEPTGTSFLILIGVGIELSLMFSVAGLVLSKVLPEDPKLKILGVNNRIFICGDQCRSVFIY